MFRDRRTERPALAEALRAQRLPRGQPDQRERPRTRAFPGKRVKVIPGQLDLYGREYRGE